MAGTTYATLDQFLNSSPVVGASASIASAISHWGVLAAVALVGPVYALPRVVADR